MGNCQGRRFFHPFSTFKKGISRLFEFHLNKLGPHSYLGPAFLLWVNLHKQTSDETIYQYAQAFSNANMLKTSYAAKAYDKPMRKFYVWIKYALKIKLTGLS